MDRPPTVSFTRRNLPHWQVVGRPYFVTFRLKGSIPVSLYRDMMRQRTALDNAADVASRNLHRQQLRCLEAVLDVPDPAVAWLRDARLASVVIESLAFAETEWAWRIPAYVVMPNHVHVLLAGAEKAARTLPLTLASIKKFTAREANRILGRNGAFWQEESFDHWCRDVGKEEACIDYIHENPVKARLVSDWHDWPWIR
jgi:REP element-mobilizing transposase RayT